jgi:hypothetical protein
MRELEKRYIKRSKRDTLLTILYKHFWACTHIWILPIAERLEEGDVGKAGGTNPWDMVVGMTLYQKGL